MAASQSVIVLVAGSLCSRAYQEAVALAEDMVASEQKSLQIEKRPYLENEWPEELRTMQTRIGGSSYAITAESQSPIIIHTDYGFMTLDKLYALAVSDYGYSDPRNDSHYQLNAPRGLQRLADEQLAQYVRYKRSGVTDSVATTNRVSRGGVSSGKSKFAYFDFPQGRVVFELFSSVLPNTVENFLQLCSGKQIGDKKYCYSGSTIHRIVRDGWIQGGDLISGRGIDNISAIGENGSLFADESFVFKFDRPGMLAMAQSRRHGNGSQFIITLQSFPTWNGKYVAFGQVISGFKTLNAINLLETANQRPVPELQIQQSDEFTDVLLDSTVSAWTQKRTTDASTTQTKAMDGSELKNKSVTLVVIGMQNSGKSTIVNNLVGSTTTDTSPTVGFELSKTRYEDFNVTFFGLGGAANIRGYWSNYFDAAHAIIYVVDSTASESDFQSSQILLKETVSHELVKGKPVLVLANKQDLTGALSSAEIYMRLEIEKISSSPICVYQTSAIHRNSTFHESLFESKFADAFKWLFNQLRQKYAEIDARVTTDVAEKKKQDRERMETLKKRLCEENAPIATMA